MSRRLLVLTVVGLAAVVHPVPAAAQAPPPRTVLLIDAYARAGGPTFTDQVDPLVTHERAAVAATYESATGIGGGIGLARRFSSRLGVLAGVAIGSTSGTAAAEGTVPHPLYFARPRNVAGSADISGSQLVVDVLATGFWRVKDRWTILAGAGPSLVRVSQDVVDGVQYTETFPYDTVTVTGLSTAKASGAGIGITGLLDATWSVGRRTGVAVFLKYTAATVDAGPDDAVVKVKAGGLRIGLGLRVRW